MNYPLGELVIYAYQNIGVRPTSILQEHMQSARMAANMVLTNFNTRAGVNLWKVDLVTVSLIEGQSVYPVDHNTILMLDAYVTNNGIDRIVLPISRTEYSSYPNKEQQGSTTVFWFDKTLSPTVTLWPVPDGQSQQSFSYYRMVQIDNAVLANGAKVDIPEVWMEAFADALSYRLARIWAPQMAGELKGIAEESYQLAAMQNVETANTFISPMIGGYFRN